MSRFPNPLGSPQLPNAYFKNILLFTLLLFINIMKPVLSLSLSVSAPTLLGWPPAIPMSIVCEPTRAIPSGFLVVKLAIVHCLSSLIKIPAETQLREPDCPFHQCTPWAARLAASTSQLVGLVWAVRVRSVLNQSRVVHLLHHNETETHTFKSQCNVRVSGSRAPARDHESLFPSRPMLHYGR